MICITCGLDKPASEFYGTRRECKVDKIKRSKRHRLEHPAMHKRYAATQRAQFKKGDNMNNPYTKKDGCNQKRLGGDLCPIVAQQAVKIVKLEETIIQLTKNNHRQYELIVNIRTGVKAALLEKDNYET